MSNFSPVSADVALQDYTKYVVDFTAHRIALGQISGVGVGKPG